MSKRPYGTQRNSDRPRAWGGARPEGGRTEGRDKPDSRSSGRDDRETRGDNRYERSSPADDGPPLIFGVHAADAALRNAKRRIVQAFVTENGENRLKDAIAARNAGAGLTLTHVTPRDLDRRLGSDTVHQGILLEVEPLPEPTLEELADLKYARNGLQRDGVALVHHRPRVLVFHLGALPRELLEQDVPPVVIEVES